MQMVDTGKKNRNGGYEIDMRLKREEEWRLYIKTLTPINPNLKRLYTHT